MSLLLPKRRKLLRLSDWIRLDANLWPQSEFLRPPLLRWRTGRVESDFGEPLPFVYAFLGLGRLNFYAEVRTGRD